MAETCFGSVAFMDERGRRQLSSLAQEILVRLTDGQTTKTIACDLGMTRDVVDWQVRRLYLHFRVKGVAQLVHAAIRDGWIEHPCSVVSGRL